MRDGSPVLLLSGRRSGEKAEPEMCGKESEAGPGRSQGMTRIFRD